MAIGYKQLDVDDYSTLTMQQYLTLPLDCYRYEATGEIGTTVASALPSVSITDIPSNTVATIPSAPSTQINRGEQAIFIERDYI